MVADTFDARWKNPPGKEPAQLQRWAQDLITELRKGAYLLGALEHTGGLRLGVYIVGASAAGSVAHTGDTNETTLVTIAVPAGSMGANGILRITTQWRLTGAGGNRTVRVRFNGTEFTGLGTAASSLSMRTQTQIANRNATNSQVGSAVGQANWAGTSTDVVTAAHDTTGDLNITLTGQLANAGDSIQVSSYLVELIIP